MNTPDYHDPAECEPTTKGASPLLLFVVNDPAFFLSHRERLGAAARAGGYRVEVACPSEGDTASEIVARGYAHHPLQLTRWGSNPISELAALWELVVLFRRIRPCIVHLVGIKAMLYGGLVARLTRVPAALFAVSGLGYVFLSRGVVASARRWLVRQLYRLAFGHRNSRVVFQNEGDLATFVAFGMVRPDRSDIVPGNGIDLEHFAPTTEPEGRPLVVLPARMLWDKGVQEFVDAAALLRTQGSMARFVLVGDAAAGNPSAVPERLLHAWTEAGTIEWWGRCADMSRVFGEANVVCLPSYREGMPQVLIEAAACGRATVTTDVSGCRDAIVPNVTGLLVPRGEVEPLARAIKRLLDDAAERARLGAAGRRHVETRLAPSVVIPAMLNIYGKLLGSHSNPMEYG